MYFKLQVKARTKEELEAVAVKLDDITREMRRYKEPRRCSRDKTTWKEFELELLLNWYERGYSYARIAKELSRSVYAVSSKLTMLRIQGFAKRDPRKNGKAIITKV